MYKVMLRKTNRLKRKLRVRKKVSGTSGMPRLSVFRSNKLIYAQLVDDSSGSTLGAVPFEDLKRLHEGVNKSDAAFAVGQRLAQAATKVKIKKVVFDRGAYKYHGRVKRLAEGAREGGLVL